MITKENLEPLYEVLSEQNYLIMRNYDDVALDINNGGDIDVLVSDRNRFVKAVGAVPKQNKRSSSNYTIVIGETVIPIDIRYIGDGYYDAEWEANMLKTKMQYENFYVMNDENYRYSILYHVLMHKNGIDEKYHPLLLNKFNTIEEAELENILRDYLKLYSYKARIPKDRGVAFNKRRFFRLAFSL